MFRKWSMRHKPEVAALAQIGQARSSQGAYPGVVRRHHQAAEAPLWRHGLGEQHCQHEGVCQRQGPHIQVAVGQREEFRQVKKTLQAPKAAAQRVQRRGADHRQLDQPCQEEGGGQAHGGERVCDLQRATWRGLSVATGGGSGCSALAQP
jgi:hypothetical protein